jgi:hypothetical protein
MLARTLATLATAALLTLSACGGDEPSSNALSGPLTYGRSGGDAGETEILTVRPDGTGSFEVDRGLKQEHTDIAVTAEESEQLAELVSGLDLGSIDVEKAEPIPDGYGYTVRYGGQEVEWEMNHQPPELEELTDELARLAEKYRP